MFEFKGTSSVDASNDSKERDWRAGDHSNLQQLESRPLTTMHPPQTSLHQRSLTEDTQRPSLLQLRSRSYSSIASQIAYHGSERPPPLSISRPTSRASIDRQSISDRSIYTRAGISERFGKTLMARGSKLLRRQNSKHDLTSLQTLEALEETNGKAHIQEMSGRTSSRQSRVQVPGDGKHGTVTWTCGSAINGHHRCVPTIQHL